jgi:hypothetical protein
MVELEVQRLPGGEQGDKRGLKLYARRDASLRSLQRPNEAVEVLPPLRSVEPKRLRGIEHLGREPKSHERERGEGRPDRLQELEFLAGEKPLEHPLLSPSRLGKLCGRSSDLGNARSDIARGPAYRGDGAPELSVVLTRLHGEETRPKSKEGSLDREGDAEPGPALGSPREPEHEHGEHHAGKRRLDRGSIRSAPRDEGASGAWLNRLHPDAVRSC